jgi:hypothetical protein
VETSVLISSPIVSRSLALEWLLAVRLKISRHVQSFGGRNSRRNALFFLYSPV